MLFLKQERERLKVDTLELTQRCALLGYPKLLRDYENLIREHDELTKRMDKLNEQVLDASTRSKELRTKIETARLTDGQQRLTHRSRMPGNKLHASCQQ